MINKEVPNKEVPNKENIANKIISFLRRRGQKPIEPVEHLDGRIDLINSVIKDEEVRENMLGMIAKIKPLSEPFVKNTRETLPEGFDINKHFYAQSDLNQVGVYIKQRPADGEPIYLPGIQTTKYVSFTFNHEDGHILLTLQDTRTTPNGGENVSINNYVYGPDGVYWSREDLKEDTASERSSKVYIRDRTGWFKVDKIPERGNTPDLVKAHHGMVDSALEAVAFIEESFEAEVNNI